MAFVAFRLGHRFRDAPRQRIVLRGLVPVTVGIVIASGYVLINLAVDVLYGYLNPRIRFS